MPTLNKITERVAVRRLKSGLGNSVILRGSDFNEVADVVNEINTTVEDIQTRVQDIEDGAYEIAALTVDTIDEATLNAGVTIDSVLLKDDAVTANEVNAASVTTPVVFPGTEPITVTTGATTAALTTGTNGNYVTTITLTGFVIGALPAAAVAAAFGNKVFEFPAGAHIYKATYIELGVTGVGTANTPNVGIGSVVGAGAVATLAGTATFQNYLEEVAMVDISGSTTATLAVPTAGAYTGIAINGPADNKDVYINAASTWAVDNTGNLTVDGVITFFWTLLA